MCSGNTAVAAEFTPILSAYIAADYRQTEIIKAQIQSPLAWTLDLLDPSISLDWTLEESTAGYELFATD